MCVKYSVSIRVGYISGAVMAIIFLTYGLKDIILMLLIMIMSLTVNMVFIIMNILFMLSTNKNMYDDL